MIKNIAYYPLQRALNGGPPMTAMISALRNAGIEPQERSLNSDALLIWSALWSGRMAANEPIYRHYRSQGKPVIIIDIGALNRGTTWKVAVNNINATGYYGHLDNLDWDRPRKMNLKLRVPTNSKSHIVIAAQHTQSEQLAGVDLNKWIHAQIQLIKHNTDRPIHIRPHPRCSLNTTSFAGVKVESPNRVSNTYDSFDLGLECHAIVNYNSGPGIQSAIAGVRPVVDMTSLAYPVSVGFADLEQPYSIDRDLWLTQISHTEYTVSELEQGLWLKRIKSALA
jgi:hypothetical protein